MNDDEITNMMQIENEETSVQVPAETETVNEETTTETTTETVAVDMLNGELETSQLTSVHDYVVNNISKLIDSTLINDNILAIDSNIDVINSLIFNEHTKHKVIVLDCTNLYMPQNATIEILGELTKMVSCQSGIIMTYVNGKIYATKNNLFVINEVDGKVSAITVYYRAKKNKVSYSAETIDMIDSTDIDLLKIQLKSRCVRVYAATKDITDIGEIHSKFMEHYKNVIDINNLIKIEYLRKTIGC